MNAMLLRGSQSKGSKMGWTCLQREGGFKIEKSILKNSQKRRKQIGRPKLRWKGQVAKELKVIGAN